jgi:hypothetical protein
LNDNAATEQQAIELQESALKIMKRRYGDEHLSTATAMNNLGFTYKLIKSYDKALPLYQGVTILMIATSPFHPFFSS